MISMLRRKRFLGFLVFSLFVFLYLFSQGGSSAQTTEDLTTADQGLFDETLFEEEEEDESPLAFDFLPKTELGYVDWVAAMKQGIISPRDSLEEGNPPGMPAIDFNVIFKVESDEVPDAVYPHLPHTLWLDCRNCHPSIFLMRAGTNPVTMAKIFDGQFCGRCHGIVAFPISDCNRCHSRHKN